MGKFKQTLLTEEAYLQLKEAKELIEKSRGRKSSFTEVIRQTIGKQVTFAKLDADVKNYINAFVDGVTSNPHILGVVLFGSVARGTFTRFSDIDIAVLTDISLIDCLDYLNREINELDVYADRLIAKGLSLYISPLIITKEDAQKLNPLYFDIAEEGILLHQRQNSVTDFFERLSRIRHRRINTSGGQILVWE